MGAESASTISTYFLLWAFRRIWNRVAAVGRLVATDVRDSATQMAARS
jgi:hypothetical protein